MSMLVFVIAYVISSLAAALPAQRYIRVFEAEAYDRPQFFARLRQDKAPRRNLRRAWLICLGVETVLLAAILYAAAFWLVIPYSYAYRTALLALAIAFFVAMALLWRKWGRRGEEMRPMYPEPAVRTSLWLFLIVMVLHTAVLVLLAMLLSLVSQWIPDLGKQAAGNYSPAYVAYNVAVILAPYLSVLLSQCLAVVLLPDLLALAAIFSRARATLAEKKG